MWVKGREFQQHYKKEILDEVLVVKFTGTGVQTVSENNEVKLRPNHKQWEPGIGREIENSA